MAAVRVVSHRLGRGRTGWALGGLVPSGVSGIRTSSVWRGAAGSLPPRSVLPPSESESPSTALTPQRSSHDRSLCALLAGPSAFPRALRDSFAARVLARERPQRP